MANVAVKRVLRAFLASPGDLSSERDLIRAAVAEVNSSISPMLDWELELVGWEETPPGYGRPQDLINRDLDRCHLFIGVLGTRWGSPTGEEESGFAEEFNRVKRRRADAGQPEIWILLRQLPAAATSDPGPQLRRVLDFRQRLVDDKLLLFKEFGDGAELAGLIRRYATQLILQQALGEFREPSPSPSPPPTSTSSQVLSDGVVGLQTGFVEIDAITQGFRPGSLVLVSSTNEGLASTFVSNVALFNAGLSRQVVGQFVLRVSREQAFLRHLVALSRIDIQRVQDQYLTSGEWTRLTEGLETLGGYELRISDDPHLSLDALVAQSYSLRQVGQPAAVVLDSIEQLGNAGTRAVATHTLKGFAETLGTVVLVGSSLPSSLRSSNAADFVVDIDPVTVESVARVTIHNRHGRLGEVELAYIPEFARFENYDPREP